MVPTSTPAKSLPSVFMVPAVTGTDCLAASEPAIASISTIGPYLPTPMTRRRQCYAREHGRNLLTELTCKSESIGLYSPVHFRASESLYDCMNAYAARARGQNVIEYGLLIASIAIVVLLGVAAFGSEIELWFQQLAGRITTVGT